MFSLLKNRPVFATGVRAPLGKISLLTLAGVVASALPAHAVSGTFTGAAGTTAYTTGNNWSGLSVPNTAAGDLAVIANGAAVTYTPGGDLTIKNGGALQVTNGSFTQVVGPAYIQLNGNGTILVDGGTFNQGTASSNPFNVTGAGNAFTLAAGAVNLSTSFNINTGLTFSQMGGTLTVAGNETDFNGGTSTLSGGVFNTKLITGVNGPAGNVFTISGGTLNLTTSNSNGIYGGAAGSHYLNFTPNSTGQITFTSGTEAVSAVQGFLSSGVIEYNNTVSASSFNIVRDAATGYVTLSLNNVASVPEPTTSAAALLLSAGCVGWMLHRRRATLAHH